MFPAASEAAHRTAQLFLELNGVQRLVLARPVFEAEAQDREHRVFQRCQLRTWYVQPVQDLGLHLCCTLAEGKRPREVVRAQHISAAARRRQFMDAQGGDIGIGLFPADARAREKRQVRVGAAHGPCPAGPAEHPFRAVSGEGSVQALFVPAPGTLRCTVHVPILPHWPPGCAAHFCAGRSSR